MLLIIFQGDFKYVNILPPCCYWETHCATTRAIAVHSCFMSEPFWNGRCSLYSESPHIGMSYACVLRDYITHERVSALCWYTVHMLQVPHLTGWPLSLYECDLQGICSPTFNQTFLDTLRSTLQVSSERLFMKVTTLLIAQSVSHNCKKGELLLHRIYLVYIIMYDDILS